MKKSKISAFLLSAIIAGSIFTGCTDEEEKNESSPVLPASTADNQEESKAPESTGDTGSEDETSSDEISSSEESKPEQDFIKIKSYKLGKDYKKQNALVVTYEWTNIEEKATSFMFTIFDKAYQNGIELESAIGVDGVDAQKQMNDIKPGITYEVTVAFVLQDKSDVSIECTDMLGYEMYLEQTLSLKDL